MVLRKEVPLFGFRDIVNESSTYGVVQGKNKRNEKM